MVKRADPHPVPPWERVQGNKIENASGSPHAGHRECVILIVHFRFDTISLGNGTGFFSGFVHMYTYFLSILGFDEIVFTINAQDFALNHIAPLQLIPVSYTHLTLPTSDLV